MDLIDEGMCFICGKRNPLGLKAEFQVDRDRLELTGTFVPRREHQGYKGIMHGGLTCALLDEAMVKLVWESGVPAVSASLEITLAKPIKVGEPIVIRGWIESRKGRVINTTARIEDATGTILAEAKGKCVQVPSKEGKGVKPI